MRVQDMTSGGPVRLILAFALPLLIGNIFQQIYTMVDTMVVGRSLGDSAIAAVGATSSLHALLVGFAIGLNSGFGIVAARCFGARDGEGLRRSIAGMLSLNGAAAAALTALSLLLLRPLLAYLNTPGSIFSQAYTYIAILCAGLPSIIFYNMFSAILRAVGNSRSPLYFLIISSLANIVLDLVMVMGLRLGVAGAAAATVIAQSASALLCGLYTLKSYRAILPGREDFRHMGPLLPELLSSGLAMALMLCVVHLGSVIFQRANNLLGETCITAHTAARRIMAVMDQPLSTVATANSTFVGQNWGAQRTDRIRYALKRVIGIELLWSVLACAIIRLSGGALVRFTTGTSNAETVQNAVLSLRVHHAFFPALGVLLCLRTAMQAMGRKAAPVASSCIELAMKMLSARWLIPRLGFLGTCVTEPVTWAVMMLFLIAAYRAQAGRDLQTPPSGGGGQGGIPYVHRCSHEKYPS